VRAWEGTLRLLTPVEFEEIQRSVKAAAPMFRAVGRPRGGAQGAARDGWFRATPTYNRSAGLTLGTAIRGSGLPEMLNRSGAVRELVV